MKAAGQQAAWREYDSRPAATVYRAIMVTDD